MNRTKKIIYWFIYASGLIWLLRRVYNKNFGNPVRILYAHRVIDRSDQLFAFLRKVGFPTVDGFERLLKHLSRHYEFIGMEQALTELENNRRAANRLVLTFDDGYACLYTRVFPLLKKYRIPATVFLTMDMVDGRRLSWYDRLLYIAAKSRVREIRVPDFPGRTFGLRTLDERKDTWSSLNRRLKGMDDAQKEEVMLRLQDILQVGPAELNDPDLALTWDQIRIMHDSGLVTFASHTMSHPIMSRISPDKARFEIIESKRLIEHRLGTPVSLFAYPNGKAHDYNADTIRILEECGYRAAVTTINGVNTGLTPRFALHRDGITGEAVYLTSLACSGALQLMRDKKRRNFLARVAGKHLETWLVPYVISSQRRQRHSAGLRHIMFCIADHFEPEHDRAGTEETRRHMADWFTRYPATFGAFRDADGHAPQHTWFYPPHHDQNYLDGLLDLCRRGYGEIEMHLHHNRMSPFPDTPESLRAKIEKCIEDYDRRGGIFRLPDGRRTFAFVHGDWSLDNAAGDEICGVNNELEILRSLGCYADFTFPSIDISQPSSVNRVYYAADDPRKPKSYDRGRQVRVGGKPWGDLLMIPGILGIRRHSKSHFFGLAVESSNIDTTDEPSRERTDYWINNAIRVKGRPNWLFIKLHTHSATKENAAVFFGKSTSVMYKHLCSRYNDGLNYALHFVTARQMYNIIKAAEAGKTGNPGDYRDFCIPRYVYLSAGGEIR